MKVRGDRRGCAGKESEDRGKGDVGERGGMRMKGRMGA